MAVERKPKPTSPEERSPRALFRPPTLKEIARRRRVFAKTRRLREEIGPVNLTTEELLAEEEDEVGA